MESAKAKGFIIQEVKAVIGDPQSFRNAARLVYAYDRERSENGQIQFNLEYLKKLQNLVESKATRVYPIQ